MEEIVSAPRRDLMKAMVRILRGHQIGQQVGGLGDRRPPFLGPVLAPELRQRGLPERHGGGTVRRAVFGDGPDGGADQPAEGGSGVGRPWPRPR